MAIRVFIGFSVSRGFCALKVKEDNQKETYSFSPVDVMLRHKTSHSIALASLAQFLEQVKENSTVIFYSNDDILAFEWEIEYKKDKKFSPKTKDVELLNEVATLVEIKHIDLTIKGEDTVLSAFGKLMGEHR